LVSASASWAVCTEASALSTDACAEAMLAGEGVLVVDVPVEPEDPAAEPDELPDGRDELSEDPDDAAPRDSPLPPVGVVDVDVLVVPEPVPDRGDGVVPVPALVVVCVAGVVVVGCVLVSETNSVVAAPTSVLALVPEPDDPEADPSSSAVS
jgi:hypothetical protein